MTHEAIENMEREIRRIPGVQRVEIHLSNWRRQDSAWKAVAIPVTESEVVDLDDLSQIAFS